LYSPFSASNSVFKTFSKYLIGFSGLVTSGFLSTKTYFRKYSYFTGESSGYKCSSSYSVSSKGFYGLV